MGTCTYHEIAAAVGLRINALVGTDPVELQVTYSTRPLTDELFDSSIFPFGAIRDAILNAEQRLAVAIGDTGNHPFRSNILSETRGLFSGENMPDTDVNGVSICGGTYGAVFDGDNPTINCTQPDFQPVESIRRYQLATSLFPMPLYNYALDGNGIIHTRQTVTVQVCIYDYEAQQNAFNANEDMLLPDALAPALIAGGVAGLVRDDEFMEQSKLYAQFFQATETAIRQGLTSVPNVALPNLTAAAA